MTEQWTKFEDEVRRILRTSYSTPEMTDETDLTTVDSLGLVEIITAAEEHLGVAMEFSEARKCRTCGELRALVAQAVE